MPQPPPPPPRTGTLPRRRNTPHSGTDRKKGQEERNNSSKHQNTPANTPRPAGQMPRSPGLAPAPKKSPPNNLFTENGNEICFTSIGDASTSEGHFWEVINAAAVLQVPLAVFVWDDGYGISVPKKYQTTKESISEALSGFDMKPTKTAYKFIGAERGTMPNCAKPSAKVLSKCAAHIFRHCFIITRKHTRGGRPPRLAQGVQKKKKPEGGGGVGGWQKCKKGGYCATLSRKKT
ncbi:MAG: hypothetical protein IPL35_12520 [Sphingobacteriales bacterium]|nr:hypothetical protein [Sphingobacteriales bacterium]